MKSQETKLIEQEIAACKQACKNHFDTLLTLAESHDSAESKDFGTFERSVFQQLMVSGELLSDLYFKKKR